MNPKPSFRAKLAVVLLLTVSLLGLIHPAAFGMNLESYGNLYFEAAERDANESFGTANPELAGDLWTYARGDFFIRGSEEGSLMQFLADVKFEGDFQSSGSPNAYLNQYYVVIPFQDSSFLYCGQKYKKVGTAKLFNITNRYDRGGYPVKIVEYDVLKSENFNYGFIAKFNGASEWNQVQYSGFFDLSRQNFNMQGYCFIEGTRGYTLAADAAYQAGKLQFYGEALFMSQSDQKIAVLNSSDSSKDVLDYRDRNNAMKFIAGMMMNQKDYSITLEYLRNNEAYNPRERDDFRAYLQRHPGGRQQYTDYYSFNWAQNYLGLSIYLPKLGNSDCSMSGSFVASIPDEGMDSVYASYQASLNVVYEIRQNLTANFNITRHFGGGNGEYLNLYEDRTRYRVSLLFSF